MYDSALVYSYLKEEKTRGGIRKLGVILGEAQRVADSLSNSQLLKNRRKRFSNYYRETNSCGSAQVVLARPSKRPSDKIMQTQDLNLLVTAYRYQSKYPEAINTLNKRLGTFIFLVIITCPF